MTTLPVVAYEVAPRIRLMERRVSLLSGPVVEVDGGILFGATPRERWGEWYRPDFNNRVRLAARGLLVQQEGKNILVLAGSESLLTRIASGCSCHRQPAGLLDALSSFGLSERDIDVVVMTHLHVFPSESLQRELQEGSLRLLFPKAMFLVGERHWARAMCPHPRDRELFIPRLLRRLQSSGRLLLLDGNSPPCLGDDWQFHVSDGYTPGQLLPEVAMPRGPILFAGDLVPGTHWLHLNVCSALCRDAERAVGEKEQLLDHLVASRGRLVFSREPEIAMVKVNRDRGMGYRYYDPQYTVSQLED